MVITLIIPGLGPREVSPTQPLDPSLSELLKRDDRQKFWLKLGTPWPDDAYGRVFLARAVDALGRAMFPQEWTGFEPSVNLHLKPLPLMSFFADAGQKNEARALLPVKMPENDDDPPLKKFTAEVRKPLTEDEWTKVRALRQATLDQIEPVRQRWAAVRQAFHVGAREGALKVYFLGRSGGDFGPTPSPKVDWNTTPYNLDNRFYCCQMNPAKPFDIGIAGAAFKWIFVDGDDLKAMVAAIQKNRKATEQQDKPHLTTTHLEAYIRAVRLEVRDNPDGPPERERLIRLGREVFKLPKEAAESGYKEGLDTAGVPHKWSQRGRKPKKAAE